VRSIGRGRFDVKHGHEATIATKVTKFTKSTKKIFSAAVGEISERV
jgi:hypothetical protein